jgi:hypothetical protein
MIKYKVNSDGTVDLLNKKTVYTASVLTEYFNVPFNVVFELARNQNEDLEKFKNNWLTNKVKKESF